MAGDTSNMTTWMRSADIRSSISRCQEIFNSGIISQQNSSGTLFESAITLLLINLSDLLAKASQDGHRVSFSDDVRETEKIKDVTDLVRTCRNAACHIGSGEHKIDFGKFTFCVIGGYAPGAFHINGIERGSDYHDDIAIYYGDNRLYVRRHLLKSFELVAAIFAEVR